MTRHPRSQLFPYTTLFRSEECRDERKVNLIENFLQDVRFGLRLLRRSPGFSLLAINPGCGGAGDRKSTRLNSSHRCISYAVFCLKKKNRTFTKAYNMLSIT